jgi:hypothetical protein
MAARNHLWQLEVVLAGEVAVIPNQLPSQAPSLVAVPSMAQGHSELVAPELADRGLVDLVGHSDGSMQFAPAAVGD